MNQTQTFMVIGLALFLVVMLVLAYMGYRRTKSMADFAIAGSKMGPVTLGLAYAATFFSAATFVGYTGWAYGWGLSSLWIFLTLILASPMGLIVVAKRARSLNTKQGSLSLPDWLGDRFRSDFLRVFVALATLFNLFYIAAQLSAGAVIFEQLLELPYIYGLIAIAAIVVLYTLFGGSFADIYTDAFQAILMAMVGVLVFVSGFWMFQGGFTDVMRQVTDTLADDGPQQVAAVNPESGVFYSIPVIIGAFIIQFAFSCQPQLFNKVLALKRTQDMAKMIITYVVTSIMFLVVIFGGFYAVLVAPGLEVADDAIFAYVQVAFPTIMVAIFGVTVMAAAMSTSDGIFVVLSTSIANDIYRKFLVPRGIVRTPKRGVDATTLTISRIATVLVGVAATLLVVNRPEFIGSFIWLGISGIASATLGPILVGIFLPKLANAMGAKISAVTGLTSYILIHIIDFEESTMAAGAWAVCIGVAAMFVGSLAFRGREGHQAVEDHDKDAATGADPGTDATTKAGD